MDSVAVLKKERAQLAIRIKALDSAIAVLGGGRRPGNKVSDAKRRKISIALKKSWAERKKKEGKKA